MVKVSLRLGSELGLGLGYAFGPSATVKNPLHTGVDASSLPTCEAELQHHNIIIGLHSWRRCRLVPISRLYQHIEHLKTDGI